MPGPVRFCGDSNLALNIPRQTLQRCLVRHGRPSPNLGLLEVLLGLELKRLARGRQVVHQPVQQPHVRHRRRRRPSPGGLPLPPIVRPAASQRQPLPLPGGVEARKEGRKKDDEKNEKERIIDRLPRSGTQYRRKSTAGLVTGRRQLFSTFTRRDAVRT